jgi:hypothetical protein
MMSFERRFVTVLTGRRRMQPSAYLMAPRHADPALTRAAVVPGLHALLRHRTRP